MTNVNSIMVNTDQDREMVFLKVHSAQALRFVSPLPLSRLMQPTPSNFSGPIIS